MKEATRTEHPAYGLAVLTKMTGGATWLFGSRVQHSSVVHLQFYNADTERDLGRDCHQGELLLDLEMSAAQWATFVSSFGNGNGTPVTFRYKREGTFINCGRVPPYINDRTQHEIEANETLTEAVQVKNELLAEFDEYANKPGKKNAAEFRRTLVSKLERVLGRLPFIAKSYKEQMHNVEQDAKIEVEAFVSNAVRDLGLEAVAKQKALPGAAPVEGYGIIKEGHRHVTLAAIASRLKANDVPFDDALVIVGNENRERCTPPLGPQEVGRIIDEVYQP